MDILQPGGASHNLNYIAGVYQYNSTSGVWTNVPWDSTLMVSLSGIISREISHMG